VIFCISYDSLKINRKSNDMRTITPAQIRAARAVLKITAQELADAAHVGVATVRRAEDSSAGLLTSAVVSEALRRALEQMGLEFNFAEDGTQTVAWVDVGEREPSPL